jgi:hypothetical protein
MHVGTTSVDTVWHCRKKIRLQLCCKIAAKLKSNTAVKSSDYYVQRYFELICYINVFTYLL